MATPDRRRDVPRVDSVLADARLQPLLDRLGRARVKRSVSGALDRVRRGELDPGAAVDAVLADLPPRATALRPTLNATGVVLHTNLGRAPLSPAAVEAIIAAAGYVDVEFDLGSGSRARRGRSTLEALRRAAPGAGDAIVVNNGAAALVLATTALAAGREVVISRGEMVEIGDGFRLPDLIESTGARLREVGTTNRATRADYVDAIGPQTGCVLKVHPSNFRVEGFTRAVPITELGGLGVPLVADIGSGLLSPDPLLPDEPDAATTLRSGATLVTCSADKLLGGPQGGLVLGDAATVERLRRHPLARALRIDKLTIAALEATLDGPPTPTSDYLHADPELLRRRCETLAEKLGPHLEVDVVASDGTVGGGGAPGLTLPGWALAIPTGFAERLRAGDPPVVGRVEHGACLLDLRCVPAASDETLLAAVLTAAGA
ncbi:MAG TPA: L-seryl-tRNA(Sec) selenium transferase [Jatrophihabitans sp.]|jgi:L-seryl-tRNA(Ser) seleniumtransferase|uniref:L-seryl-tRNA(Sec) selenium transferase n=1 Tax=Jatrophihabitans sp. TaxID=1932789 RepID=UPI002E05ED42|nr:L-seryl-tRNA(Sec) selenium transferase [Jatrophihabitans sp.]